MNGYFLKGFADQLNGGLMGRGDRLAKERFNYQKQRDDIEDSRYKGDQAKRDFIFEQQKRQAELDAIRTEQAKRDAELKNKEYYGMRNTIARGLMPANPDVWLQKEYFNSGDDGRGRTLPEMQYLAGIQQTEDAKNILGIDTQTKTAQDTAVLTTAAKAKTEGVKQAAENKQYQIKLLDTLRKDRFSAETDLRKEANAYTKTYRDGDTAAKKLKMLAEEALTADNPAATLGMIFSYMKTLDPGSVVRESEYAAAENSRGLFDIAQNIQNRIVTGERISPKQIMNFVRATERLQKAVSDDYTKAKKQYKGIVDTWNKRNKDNGILMDWNNVWIEPGKSDDFSMDVDKNGDPVVTKNIKTVDDIIKEVDAEFDKPGY